MVAEDASYCGSTPFVICGVVALYVSKTTATLLPMPEYPIPPPMPPAVRPTHCTTKAMPSALEALLSVIWKSNVTTKSVMADDWPYHTCPPLLVADGVSCVPFEEVALSQTKIASLTQAQAPPNGNSCCASRECGAEAHVRSSRQRARAR
jgi:hypothetical protein